MRAGGNVNQEVEIEGSGGAPAQDRTAGRFCLKRLPSPCGIEVILSVRW